MTPISKSIWYVLALAGLVGGLWFTGCGSMHGPVSNDVNVEQPDTNGVNSAIVGTNLSQGLTLTFPTNITAELQSLLNAAGIQTPSPQLAIVPQVTTDPAQRKAIAAAIKAHAEITELK